MSRRRHDSDGDDLSPPRSSYKSDRRRSRSPPRKRSPLRRRDERKRSESPPPTHKPNPRKISPTRSSSSRHESNEPKHGIRYTTKDTKGNHSKGNEFTGMSDEMMGKNATTVYRDRTTGRIRDLESESKVKVKKDLEAEKLKEEKELKYKTWSKGLKQVEKEKERVEEVLHEMSKPLSRYIDDSDRDEYLKRKELDDDPMLQFMRKKKKQEAIESATAKGEIYVEKPMYKGPEGPPNRFGIRPGYRWDGVDRSNGYEKKIFEKEAEKNATKDEAYKWSTEDM